MVFAICGCSKDEASGENAPNAEPSFQPASESARPSPDDELVMVSTEADPRVFDFAEFPEEQYPRGSWSVNQLFDRYGFYDEIVPDCWYGNGVSIGIAFEDIEIILFTEDATVFSFYDESLEFGNYDLNAGDKDLALEILFLNFTDPELALPYGVEIGKSTIADFISVYPESPAFFDQLKEESDSYRMIYRYRFYAGDGDLREEYYRKSGYVDYYFDENEILTRVRIIWLSGDV